MGKEIGLLMFTNKKKISVSILISAIIIVGFILSGLCFCFSFYTFFKEDVESVSELTSENIYSNINDLMNRPINVSLAMAQDTFLRDFMNEEPEQAMPDDQLERMKEYLSSYQEKYQFDSVFFVSVKSGAYYHYAKGIDRFITPDNPENDWYYNFLDQTEECSLNVDNDEAKDDMITIFVNCKLYDENNQVLGVIGVGMETPYIQDFLLENEQKYGVHAYLIDAKGTIQLSSNLTEYQNKNLFTEESFQDMAEAIHMNMITPNRQWYHSARADGYIITKYVPDLNWYLVVEKNTQDFMQMMLSQFYMNFIFGGIIVLIVILITTRIIRSFNRTLVQLAEKDPLTGLKNRTSYEREIQKYSQQIDKLRHFGIGIFDLNNLKVTNDLYGHQAGDTYIKTFSALLGDIFMQCPIFRIGGDEFAIIFRDFSETEVLEGIQRLSKEMKKKEEGMKTPMSATFGYSFYEKNSLNTVEKMFKDADDKMYLDKARQKLMVNSKHLQ